jgi:hypothetical protein
MIILFIFIRLAYVVFAYCGIKWIHATKKLEMKVINEETAFYPDAGAW